MVFGLGAGRIDLRLEKRDFCPGETIKGDISLKLKKPVKARKLSVHFWGERKVKRPTRRNGKSTMETRTEKVYSFELPLGDEKEYVSDDYSFEVQIPDDILPPEKDVSGIAGTVMSAVSILAGSNGGPVKWYVKADLDVPLGFNVKNQVQVTLSRKDDGVIY